MNILQTDDQFLADHVHVDAWSQSQAISEQAYQPSLRNVFAIDVVNNSAERGVKLSSDFLAAAHSEKHYQNYLQVVEQDRKTDAQSYKHILNKNLTSLFTHNGCFNFQTHKGWVSSYG